MPVMDIQLRIPGIQARTEEVRGLAREMRSLAAAEQKLSGKSLTFKTDGLDVAAQQLRELGDELQRVGSLKGELGNVRAASVRRSEGRARDTAVSGRSADAGEKTPSAGKSAYPVGPAQRLAQARETLTKAQGNGATPDQLTDAQIAFERAQRAFERAQRSPEPARRASGEDRFITGPSQKLLQIEEQKSRASGIRDEQRRAAVMKDLEIQEFRARRSLTLGQRRLDQGDSAVNQPGLLDLFGELNGLMGSLRAGNTSLTVRHLARGIELLQETGGLNITQKTAGIRGLIAGRAAAGAGGIAATETAAAAAGLGALTVALGVTVGVVTAGTVAVGAFIHAVNAAGTSLNDFAAGKSLSGGTTGQTAGLRAIGIDPSSQAALAAQLRERLGSDPHAMAAGARLGAGYRPGRPYGPVNEARDLEAVLRGLRSITDAELQLAEARKLGLEGTLESLRVSDRVFEAQMQDAGLAARIYSPEQVQAARDYAAELERNRRLQEDLKTSIGSIGLQGTTEFLHELNSVIRGMGIAANWARPALEALGIFFKAQADVTSRIAPLLGQFRVAGDLFGGVDKLFGGSSAGSEQARTNEILEEQLDVQRQMLKRGFSGTGPRGTATAERLQYGNGYLTRRGADVSFGPISK